MITEVLESRGFELKKKTAKEYATRCPFCGGVDRFCVWPEDNRYWCRQCDNKGDDIQLLRDMEGMSFHEAAEAVGKDHKINKPISKPPKKSKDMEIIKYNYVDESGNLLFVVCKQEDPKEFWQRGPKGEKKVTGIRQVLYRLPELTESSYVLFCEGEKDTDNCRKLGFTATTTPMGAGKIETLQKKHKILDPLTGKRVFILADYDEAGEAHALQVAQLLHGKAEEVRIVRFPELPENGDVSDFIQLHGEEAKAKLIEKIAEAPIWTPPKKFFSIDDLLDLPEDGNQPIIGKGIMPYNSHILIAGEGGVGKSLLRLELAIHIALGWEWQGFTVPRARRVCIFQWENSERTEQKRLKKMMGGLGIQRQALSDRLIIANREDQYDLTLKRDRDRLRQAVKESGAEVIIYDCLSNLHSANENDNVRMREILDVLSNINARLKTSCIIIHHFGKPGENPSANRYRIRGATSITDWPYTVITLTRKPNEERVLRQIEFTKVRDGATPKPFLVERNPITFIHTYTEEETLASPQKVREVLEGLGGIVETQKAFKESIIEATGCGGKTAWAAIKNAVKMKEIYEFKSGKNKKALGYKIDPGEIENSGNGNKKSLPEKVSLPLF